MTMRMSVVAPLIAAALLFSSRTASAACGGDTPCGPDDMPPALRGLIPQGFAGADFRPACRRHDNCYDTRGACKHQCDLQFKRDAMCACNCSRHPIMCRGVVQVMYAAEVLLGGPAFRKAQKRGR